MIKVLNIISDSNIGGAGKCVIYFCKSYNQKEFDLSVVVPKNSELIPELKKTSAKVIEIDGLKDKSLDFKSFFKLRKIIKDIKPDIVHTHASSIARLAARFVPGTKIIYTRHSVFPVSEKIKHGIGKFIYKTSNELTADRIIAVAEAAKENLTDGGIDENMIDVVLNGVEQLPITSNEEKEKLKKKYKIAPDEKVIGILARLNKVKGHEYFIDAAKIILDKKIKAKFLILGTGDEEKELKEKVKKLKLDDKIIFTGFVKNVKDFVNIFDVQVNCSYGTEATSLALLEGMSIGVPAVVTNYGGNPGVIKDGENGFLVPIKSPQETADAIIKLLENKELYKEISNKSKQIYNEKFTIDVYSRNIERVYKEVFDTKFKKKINLLDIIIILAVLVVGLVGYKFLKKTDVITPSTVKITYRFRSDEQEPASADMITDGILVYDSVKNYYIGKVVKKEVVPATRDLYDEVNDQYKQSEVPGMINIILTIEADGIVQGKDILLDNQYDLKVGNQAFLKGKGYASMGYIIGIERLEK